LFADKAFAFSKSALDILAGNNNEAAKKLNEGKDDSALASYLKAVIAARNNDNSNKIRSFILNYGIQLILQ